MTAPSVPTPAPAAPRRFEWRRILGLAAVVLVCLAGVVGILSVIGYHVGPIALTVGICAALLPVPFLIAAFMWLDRYEPEPLAYMAFCFFWGAGPAASSAYGGNTLMAAVFKHAGLPDDLVAVLVAPFIEESLKALGPVLLLLYTLWRRRQVFNGLVDAIVYFGLSATGFAMSENVLYLGGYGYAQGADQGGTAGGISATIGVFIGRIPLSGFAHPLFTSMTAVGVGLALRATNRRLKVLAPILGWITAMLMHGSWNLMATLAQHFNQPAVLLYGYFAVMMPIFFGQVGFAMWLRSEEGRLTQEKLAGYVRAGWLSPPEVATLASVGRRRSARAWALRVAGKPGTDGMRGFQLAATRLALLRDSIDRRTAAARPISAADLAAEQQLLALIGAYRAVYTGRDPAAPRAFWDGTAYRITMPDGSVRGVLAPAAPVVPTPVVRAPIMPPYPGWPGYPGYPGFPPGPPPPQPPQLRPPTPA